VIVTSAQLLEWQELKVLLARYIAGPLGRTELENLEPRTDPDWLAAALVEVDEAMTFVRTNGRLPIGGLVDSTQAVQKLRIEGAGLDGEEIADLGTFLERAMEVKSALSEDSDRYPTLAKRAVSMGDFRTLLREIGGKVLPNGTVADDASVALNRLRRDIERQGRAIHQSLEKFLRAHREEGVLQEEYVAIRNDRFVVPVIAGQRRKVDGVIHSASSSGQTLFIEPLETIDLNNELVRLREEEAREVHRILRELTAHLRTHYAAIHATMAVVSALDLLFAKASFAQAFNCVVPRFSPENARRVILRQARHPLLEDVLKRQGREVVPISLSLDEKQRILLISGPNTGGKTVSMKTAGLLALMAHAAIPTPAAEVEFPLFDQVLADIGDQQSIEQSLSTFSAHITGIREMVEVATERSLVLLDELGRATDPEEGGALGVAILERFRTLGCITLASTHLMALKVYGANTPAVLNASMGFDEATLQPTYVLRLGAPGKSAGLDIAKRLGMPASLIDRARAAMSTAERDIARFLSELHQRLETTAAVERELTEKLEKVRVREADLQRNYQKREAAKMRELQTRWDEVVANFEARALDTIENIKELREHRKVAEQALRQVSKAKREGREDLQTQVIAASEEPKKYERLAIAEGVRVRLKGIRQPARVRRVLNEDVIEVEAGLLKMQVSVADVEEVLPEQTPDTKLPKNITFHQAASGPKWDVSYREINLLGRRAEEAVEEVDRFLDQAALASVDRVRIVHGHGMGVLKRAVADLLTRHPHVAKFYSATPSEGGSGATIAELKAS
jgi:DNA mismatch repair protein MutS2